MSVLFFCNTYYQVIVAMQLRLTEYRNCRAGLCLTNHSAGSKEVCSRLESIELFDDVLYWENRDSMRGAFGLKKIFKLIQFCAPPKKTNRFGDYDTVVFFNISYATYEIVHSLSAGDCPVRLLRMEEGLATCSSLHSHGWRDTLQLRILDDLWRVRGRSRLADEVEGFYCFLPELCDANFPLPLKRIPSVLDNKDELVGLLKHVFSYRDSEIPQDYIFFASSLDADGRGVGETDMVMSLANLIGKENLLIKKHPRDSRTVYEDAGLSVMESSSTPWEVVQLCQDLSNKMLLTCTSGAPLAVPALLGSGPAVYYLRPEMRSREQEANYYSAVSTVFTIIDKLHEIGLCKEIERGSCEALFANKDYKK